MKHYIGKSWRAAALVSATLLLSALAPRLASAQQSDSVYTASDVSTAPRLVSMAATARLVQRSYPDPLKRAGIGGNVQLEFVIDSQGKVDPGSIQVVMASVPALGEAAKAVARDLEFSPGKVNGTPVRTRVLLPLMYKAN